jgi:predicted DCC family thiol-disulfide oxidoreductase YuxK
MSGRGPHAALLYDAGCGFCTWCLGVILAWDRRGALRPVPIAGPEGDALLADLDPATRMASWHLVPHGGPRASGGAAVAPLLRLLPGGGLGAALADRVPGAVEGAYRWVVRHRGRLGRIVGRRAVTRARRRVARRS